MVVAAGGPLRSSWVNRCAQAQGNETQGGAHGERCGSLIGHRESHIEGGRDMANLSRRRFMGLLGLGVGGGAVLSACGATPTPQVIERVVEKE
ncbi:MAG: twin-arginine translocation signal domain-containing protein, partial [Anaerolineae bacterium]|nr:twin-arginine translocation signal domain-containing protein [Anaerolineae bacterium]